MQSLEKYFDGFTIKYIERGKNEEADLQAKITIRGELITLDVFYQVIEIPFVRQIDKNLRLMERSHEYTIIDGNL